MSVLYLDKLFNKFEKFSNTMFDIREGEGKRTFLMFLYIFLIISTLLILKPVSNSLFLSKFGAKQLPFAFIFVAIFAAMVVSIYSNLLKQGKLQYSILLTLKYVIGSLLLIRFFLYFQILESFILYVFYIWVAIFAVIATSQFWILANLIFNAREAKRLFGFIGSGAIAGGIFGGYLTKLLAPVLRSENLLFICIIFILFSTQIVKFLWKENISSLEFKFYQTSHESKTVGHPLLLIKNSRHLTFLALLVGIGVLVARLVDYQFSAISTKTIADDDQLTAFFGFWLSNLNIISLLIQLFITRRIVGIFGVGISLFFLPIGILFGAVTIFINPALWAAILIKVTDGSLKNSINKAGIELLALPIPSEIKSQAKSFIDVFIDSFATGISGLLLVLFTIGLSFSTGQVSFLIILLLFVWIYLVTRIRSEYIQSFRLKVEQLKEQEDEKLPDLQNESVFGGIIKILEGKNEKQILHVLRIVKEIQNPRLIPTFKNLLTHPSCEIRLEVLKNLYFYKQDNFIPVVETLLKDSAQEIRTEAIHYIFQHAGEDRISKLLSLLNHGDTKVSSSALLCAARESRNNHELQMKFDIKNRVERNLKQLQQITDPEYLTFTKCNSARIIGSSNILELYPYLHILLNDPIPEVKNTAILSAGETQHKDFIPILIRFLKVKATRQVTQIALMSYGPEIIDVLNVHLNNPYVHEQIRMSIPKIFSSFGTQKSVDFLIKNLELLDVSVRYKVIRALNQLKVNHPILKFDVANIIKRIFDEVKDYVNTLAVLYNQINANSKEKVSQKLKSNPSKVEFARRELIKALEKRLDQNLERIFRLLGLKYPPDDIYNIYLGIRSNKPDMRINSIEFLDNLLDTSLKKMIIPIIETTMVENLIDNILEKYGLKLSTEFDYLVNLLSSQDNYLQEKTLYLIAQLKDERYIPFIGALINSPSANVRKKARLTLNNLDLSI